jgi:hypothetical protein
LLPKLSESPAQTGRGITNGKDQAEGGQQQQYGFSWHQRQALLGAGERLMGIFSLAIDKYAAKAFVAAPLLSSNSTLFTGAIVDTAIGSSVETPQDGC